jgi:DNA-binding transcriptional ArsR family regulator
VWPGEIGHLEVIDRDAEGKRRLSRSLSFGRFMVRATGGIYLRHLPAGIDTVVLAPSYVSRPWVNSTMANGALVIVAPVSDASLGPAESLPQRRYARLANAYRARHRLELMRALAQGEKTLAELAAGLDVPAGRLRRDLLSLRTAGLVQLSGETHRFRMSSGSVSDLGQLLGASLGAPRGAPPN